MSARPNSGGVMDSEKLVEQVALGIRKRQIERTTSGRCFDPSVPPTESELDNARAAVRLVVEECEARVALHDKTGRDWIPGSLWDQLTKETCARIHVLLPKE